MKRLVLEYKGVETVSNPFSMGVYRIMYDALDGAETLTEAALDAAALEGVAAMFDGTAITRDALRAGGGIDGDAIFLACVKTLAWYRGVNARGGEALPSALQEGNPIHALYKAFIPHKLPGELDKEDPQLLFDVLAAETRPSASADDIPDDLKVFYGL